MTSFQNWKVSSTLALSTLVRRPPLRRPESPLERVVLPVADGTEQHRVGGLRQLQRRFGQRMAMRLVGGTADQRLFGFELQVERAEHAQGLGDDLGADAVAWKNRDL